MVVATIEAAALQDSTNSSQSQSQHPFVPLDLWLDATSVQPWKVRDKYASGELNCILKKDFPNLYRNPENMYGSGY